MKDEVILGSIAVFGIASCYIAYVVTTHGDGMVFSAACTAIGGIMTYLYGLRKGTQKALLALKNPGETRCEDDSDGL